MAKIQRIGLFGGSFDPVHLGHIKLAAASKREFKLDRVFFIPARQPPHKKYRFLTPPLYRVKMLSLALKPYSSFFVSRFELKRRNTTYTFQTVNHFKKAFPGSTLFLILGSDSFNELRTWKKPNTLASTCIILAGARAGEMPAADVKIPFKLLKNHIPPFSSSKIRELCSEEKSIKGMVPAAVEKYIKRHGLYRR